MLENISDKLVDALAEVSKKLDDVRAILDKALTNRESFIDDKSSDILELQLKVLLCTRHNQDLLDVTLGVHKIKSKETIIPRSEWRNVFLGGDSERAAEMMVEYVSDRTFGMVIAKRVLAHYAMQPF